MKFAADSPWLPIRFGIREEPLKFSPNNALMKFAAGSDGDFGGPRHYLTSVWVAR